MADVKREKEEKLLRLPNFWPLKLKGKREGPGGIVTDEAAQLSTLSASPAKAAVKPCRLKCGAFRGTLGEARRGFILIYAECEINKLCKPREACSSRSPRGEAGG